MRKKLLLLFLTIVAVACLAFGVTACGGGSSSTKDTYYLYKNGSYDYTNYITLSGSSWEDDDGETGTYKISGSTITFYYELLGETEELMDGTISDGVMTLNIMGATYTYCLEGKTPSSSGTDDGDTSTTYTVTYNANGGAFADGSETYTQTVNSGTTLTAPASPTKDGCTFAGWATSKNGSTMWQFGSDKVTSNTTLYASWSEQSASILSVDGASIDGTEISMLVDHNTDSVSLSTKVVCSSDSTWKLYYDKLGQTEIPTKIAASTTGSLYNGDNVFYIVVTSTDGTQVNVYTLTIYRSYAVYVTYYDGTTAIKTETAYTGYSFTTTYTPDISGYTFNYWKASSGSKFTETTLTSALSLYADKTANDYTITYDVNGGDELTTTTKTVTYDSSYTLVVPERTGYSFSGWYCGSTQLTDEDGKSLAVWSYADDTAITAKWTANDYTITLNLSNSSAGTVIGDGDHAYDSSVTITATTNSGYTWLGWYDSDGELVSTNASYTFTMGFNVSYTAKWTYYTFTTHVSDGAAGSVSNYLNVAVKVTVGTSITITATTNSGYTFVGWYNDDDELVFSNLSYTFKMPEKDLEYTAKWCKVTVTVNNASAGSVTSLNSTYKVGDEATIAATTNNGYTFIGWYKGETLATTNLSYTFTMTAESVTYTAKWMACPVTLEKNIEKAGEVDGISKTIIGNEVTITATTNDGYTFIGWYNGNTTLTSALSYTFTMSTESVTYTAKWMNNRITISSDNTSGGEVSGLTNSNNILGNTITITADEANLGYTFLGWYNGDTQLDTGYSYSVTITETATDYVAKYEVNSEMANFEFTSTTETCEITGIINNTVTEIVVPNYVTDIASGAFSGCGSLVSITLPFIGGSASATSASSASSSTLFGYVFGTSSYKGGTSTRQYYLNSSYSTYYIPATLTTVTMTGGGILYGAFYNCTALTSITIPDNVTFIDGYAFYNCTALTSITIPDNVTFIDGYAFYNCTSLESVTIPDNVTSIYGYTFAGCTALTSVTIPNSVTSIGKDAFVSCTALTSVTIPDSVTSIGESAFNNCTSLTSITIPDSITSIGDYAFSSCHKLIEVYNLSSLTITAGSTDNGYVGYYTKNVYTPKSGSSNLITQDGYIFYNDSGTYYLMVYAGSDTALTLPTLTINGEMASYSIYQYAFYNNKKITSVTIPDSVTSIGKYAFWNCDLLTSVTIGNSVISIADYAFWNCDLLTSVTIGKNVTSIGSFAFDSCNSLTSVTIPSSVTSIGNGAFWRCDSLASVAFENTSGWYVTTTEGSTNGTTILSSSLSNTSTAAEYLTNTYAYNYYWYKK